MISPKQLLAGLLLSALISSAALGEPGQAKLAIIIDDLGYNLRAGLRTIALPGAYTLALLPSTPHTLALAQAGAAEGKELMLHAPMANTAGLALGPGALTESMSRAEFTASLRHSLEQLPGIKGVNNHMGSALTPLPRPMGWVMTEAAKRDLYFVDSRTTASSRAYEVASAYGLASAQRDVFLDHERDRAHIATQLKRAIAIAQHKGQAIAIGHPYPETLDVLEQAEPLLRAAKVSLVPASQLVRKQTPGAQACLLPPVMLRRPLTANAPVFASKKWWVLRYLMPSGYERKTPVEKHDINTRS
ncbi:divergent polysaccharide deacetylase family protein [Gilvimarinus sp. DA14]|uniref:divergent polysaccharide deacetylase family protein n=1 Tax=Gilvimarinus sp. DA14 TaxID=2956798 RepID=UPI0020B871A3|nr:divergent polysaccharide deacetylase family protein [Gilvimarinus sp. DA14]UTF58694.1 divergent polysaccharide deacetylase family protein [Gilvimarinus sp. DA14]